MAETRTIVVGAGAGGIAAAIALAAAGRDVLVLERGPRPGGKMRDVSAGGSPVPGGPTVMTMRWAFDDLLATAGTTLEEVATVHPSRTLARHAWTDGSRLDLMADTEEAADAIGNFAGAAEAEGFRSFTAEARRIHDILLDTHMRAQRPSFAGLMGRIGPRRFPDMLALRPYSSLWKALQGHFTDPRLIQLFGRYSTYTGSSPFAIPATLMLVAHAEREGVWRVEGGMAGLARVLVGVAEGLGVSFRYGAQVSRVEIEGGRATGVRLAGGERVPADGVVLNCDANAVHAIAPEAGVPRVPAAKRSYSAITICAVARTDFPLAHHTVFFSDDYRAEFDALAAGRVPDVPSTYICAPDRDDGGARTGTDRTADGAERMLMLVNAPPDGDRRDHAGGVERCRTRMVRLLERCGMECTIEAETVTTPTGFAALHPGTGGALYGRTTDGPFAGFRRPGALTAVPNIVLAGGSCHPGPGVPMATVSGHLAAEALLGMERREGVVGARRPTAARASTRPSRRAATSGGTSTASPTTAPMPSRS